MSALLHAPHRETAQAGPAYHVPVLCQEVVDLLQPAPGKCLVDGTLGGGGHSRALLERGATVIGIDQDPEALAFASQFLAGYGPRFIPVQANFSAAGEELDRLGYPTVDGVLLDIGVSSHQLETAERGFSLMRPGPLDMRMNPAGPLTAADLVNTAGAAQLERVLRQYGEEPAAKRIANRILRDRQVRPFTTTTELAESVESVVPRRGKVHPATRVFQALRMAVNRELEALALGLETLSRRLAPGGRFAVIAFHSLEDRIVKQFFARHAAETVDDPSWPSARPNPVRLFKKITGKALVAGPEEQRRNPRARSAKLRVVERV